MVVLLGGKGKLFLLSSVLWAGFCFLCFESKGAPERGSKGRDKSGGLASGVPSAGVTALWTLCGLVFLMWTMAKPRLSLCGTGA